MNSAAAQQVKEKGDVRDARAIRWLDDAVRDLQFVLRTYRRMPAFAFTSVLTLALGVGVNTALFTVARQVLLNALPVTNPQELVEIECSSRPNATGGGQNCMQSYPAFELVSKRRPGLSSIFAFSPVGVLPRSFRGVTFGEVYDVVLPLRLGNDFRVPGILANRNIGWLTFM